MGRVLGSTWAAAWRRYPVLPGELWAVGPHLLLCGDLERHDHRRLLEGRAVDVMYADPPWDAGNARAFRTKAGDGRRVDFPALLAAVADATRFVRAVVFLEMGLRSFDLMVSTMQGAGLHTAGQWLVWYGRPPRPNMLWAGARGPVHAWRSDVIVDGKGGEPVPEWALSHAERSGWKTVLDPCIGLGMTARVAHRHGLQVLGMELHPKRLAVTIAWLARRGLDARRLEA